MPDTCNRINSLIAVHSERTVKKMNKLKGFMCSSPRYKYDGWFFEYRPRAGPCPLTKEGEPRKRVGKKFYDLFDRFLDLPEEEQKKYRVGGGCDCFQQQCHAIADILELGEIDSCKEQSMGKKYGSLIEFAFFGDADEEIEIKT